MIYQNFDLEIICPNGGTRLCARVLESPQGDCPFVDVKWPFDAEQENAMLAEIYGGLRQRRGRPSQANAIQDFGGKLFEAVFCGDIEHLYRSSLDTVFRSGKGLRVRLRLPEDSELHVRPWEFLFDTESREFLAVREHTPLVRYLPVAQPTPPITVEGPLRVLVALSSPTDHPRLDIAREWDILCDALEPSITAGQLELRRVPGHCTFDNLRDSLRHYGAHIFHFVGHGVPGALVLEQESGKGLEMEATHLRSAFPSGALPRLIVLNACSGAITQDTPFSGLAQGFLRQGVPAVVAMQASITDDAALILTRYFYRDLIEIGAVDTSLTEARLRMQANGHPIEWGTPVLYMRALSGQLFQPASKPAAYPSEWTLPKEIPAHAEVFPSRIEPSLSERKRTKDSQVKQDAPLLQPGPGQTERKKPRTPRTRETVSKPASGPGLDEQAFLPKAEEKAFTPMLKPEPDPPGHDFPPQARPEQPALPSRPEPAPDGADNTPRPQPADATLPRTPEPGPAGQDAAPKAEARVATPPRKPKPTPAGQDAAPKASARVIMLPRKPEPRPAEQDTAVRAEAPVPTPPPQPAPQAAGQHVSPTAQPQAPPQAPSQAPPQVSMPPPVHLGAAAGQVTPPKAQAKKHTPPPKQEPVLDKLDMAPDTPAPAFIPRFSLEPEPGKQDITAAAERPQPVSPEREPEPMKAAVPAPRRKRLIAYGAAASLLAALGAVGMNALLPSADSTSPPVAGTPGTPPASTSAVAPATPAATVGPAPAATPDATPAAAPRTRVTPSPALQNGEAPRIVSGSVEQLRPDRNAQAKAPATRPKSSASTSRKTQPPPKRTPAAADNCKSPVPSERGANCVFQ